MGYTDLLVSHIILLVELVYFSLYKPETVKAGWDDEIRLERLSPWDKDFKWTKDEMYKRNAGERYSILEVIYTLSNFSLNSDSFLKCTGVQS